jgi:hypothetical protein
MHACMSMIAILEYCVFMSVFISCLDSEEELNYACDCCDCVGCFQGK